MKSKIGETSFSRKCLLLFLAIIVPCFGASYPSAKQSNFINPFDLGFDYYNKISDGPISQPVPVPVTSPNQIITPPISQPLPLATPSQVITPPLPANISSNSTAMSNMTMSATNATLTALLGLIGGSLTYTIIACTFGAMIVALFELILKGSYIPIQLTNTAGRRKRRYLASNIEMTQLMPYEFNDVASGIMEGSMKFGDYVGNTKKLYYPFL